MFMVFEYFSMVFLRSRLGIGHFARTILAYFCVYQSYFVGTLYGMYWCN